MLAFLLCLFAADSEPAPDMKVIASGAWRHAASNGKKLLVIRKAADLEDLKPYVNYRAPGGEIAAAHLAADLKVKKIDWDKQMALLILVGERDSGGYSVEVKGLKIEKGVLTVSWKENAPKGPATDAITYPNRVVLVPRFTGKVVFDPPLGK